jgi:hypothetical protein
MRTTLIGMSKRGALPSGLAEMPPGASLAAVLESVDVSRLGSADVYTLLEAEARQAAHSQARVLSALYEAARCVGDEDSLERADKVDEFSADQPAFTLRWTRSRTQSQLGLAEDLITRLPAVFASLHGGRIDVPKAMAFSNLLHGLDDDKAGLVVDKLLVKAEQWTTSQLRERLRYHVMRVDPEAIKTKYEQSVVDRRVYFQPGVNGTAELGGVNLPPDRAAAAAERIEALARAAKHDGDPRTISQLRADFFIDSLAGIECVIRPSRDPFTAAADAGHEAYDGERTIAPAAEPPLVLSEDDPIGAAVLGEAFVPAPAGTPVRPGPRRGAVEIQVKLTTLMCLNEDPALIPGFGPVIADIARQVAFDQETKPAWLWSVTDDQGNLLHHGHTKRRPNATEKAFVKARDKTCRAPGCRRKATWCDDDHRREYQHGGPSHRGNLCVLCRHHHRLRHERGFRVTNIHGSTNMWTAPNGHFYLVRPDANVILTAEEHGGALLGRALARALRQ